MTDLVQVCPGNWFLPAMFLTWLRERQTRRGGRSRFRNMIGSWNDSTHDILLEPQRRLQRRVSDACGRVSRSVVSDAAVSTLRFASTLFRLLVGVGQSLVRDPAADKVNPVLPLLNRRRVVVNVHRVRDRPVVAVRALAGGRRVLGGAARAGGGGAARAGVAFGRGEAEGKTFLALRRQLQGGVVGLGQRDRLVTKLLPLLVSAFSAVLSLGGRPGVTKKLAYV